MNPPPDSCLLLYRSHSQHRDGPGLGGGGLGGDRAGGGTGGCPAQVPHRRGVGQEEVVGNFYLICDSQY